jgi:hypothetical protein
LISKRKLEAATGFEPEQFARKCPKRQANGEKKVREKWEKIEKKQIGLDLRITEKNLDRAIERKWAEGREKYGPAWTGKPPLEELFEEQLDSINYVNEAERRGEITPELARSWRGFFRLIAARITSIQAHNAIKNNERLEIHAE